MPLLANYHTHTTFCDGTSTAEEQVQQAIRLGFRHLGFSGHMDPDIHMVIQDYYKEIRRLRDKYSGQIEILCGVELDNIYGLFDRLNTFSGCGDGSSHVGRQFRGDHGRTLP